MAAQVEVVTVGAVGPPGAAGPSGSSLLATIPDLSIAAFHDLVFPAVPNATHRGYRLVFHIGPPNDETLPLFFSFRDASNGLAVSQGDFAGAYTGTSSGGGAVGGQMDSDGMRLGGLAHGAPAFGEIIVHQCGNNAAQWEFSMSAKGQSTSNYITQRGGRGHFDLSFGGAFVYDHMRFHTTFAFPSGALYLFGF